MRILRYFCKHRVSVKEISDDIQLLKLASDKKEIIKEVSKSLSRKSRRTSMSFERRYLWQKTQKKQSNFPISDGDSKQKSHQRVRNMFSSRMCCWILNLRIVPQGRKSTTLSIATLLLWSIFNRLWTRHSGIIDLTNSSWQGIAMFDIICFW